MEYNGPFLPIASGVSPDSVAIPAKAILLILRCYKAIHIKRPFGGLPLAGPNVLTPFNFFWGIGFPVFILFVQLLFNANRACFQRHNFYVIRIPVLIYLPKKFFHVGSKS
jgi:hypothetical protein